MRKKYYIKSKNMEVRLLYGLVEQVKMLKKLETFLIKNQSHMTPLMKLYLQLEKNGERMEEKYGLKFMLMTLAYITEMGKLTGIK